MRSPIGEKRNFQVAALDLAQREGKAMRAIHREVSTLLKEGRCVYVPREKPENSCCLIFEYFNSLGVFMGKSKIHRVNDLVSKYEVRLFGRLQV